ncbi:MAG: hypothetical protein NUW23_08495 [Firmicutes bacterium]|jgi:hypothetical protein|nr:hypothetical protein [Bacillota bacterium]
MTATVHACLGACAARVTRDPALAFALGLVSHCALDMVPHSDYQKPAWAVLDIVTAAVLIAGCWNSGFGSRAAVAGTIGAVLPDVEVVLSHLSGGNVTGVFPTHSGFLPHGKMRGPAAFLVQAAVGASALAMALGVV